ncbi:MAG: 2-oxoacid:acceptor oxidoreductase family protein [Firmicutes bacterium]|nr:2-oxoacid:acceptor oxidoreductase family protein [Bacillota bacterium]MCL5039229.1 2-oxoacid:acceptor oxidoreductase family protein [Bacillota bacterium]
MGKSVEIRWHARGGQGAKTAALLLAEAAAAAGLQIQGFPEYGPERMGAPMLAFNRISHEKISIHSGVENPDIVMVLDPSLIGKTGITDGVSEEGVVIINTPKTPREMRQRLGITYGRVYTLDANQIALETIGRAIPNTPMMGALIKVAGIMDFPRFLEVMKEQLQEKFRSKREVIEGNVKAIERAYQEVQGE